MTSRKILLTHPDFNDPGGVSAYYRTLRYKFRIPLKHFIVGKRPDEKSISIKLYRLLRDYIIFLRTLRTNRYSLVHINPSLDWNSVLRDGVFNLLTKAYNKKTVVFFHGWDKSCEILIERKCLRLFKFLFGTANVFIVLSNDFKNKLEAWRFSQPIYREVTVIDDSILDDFDIRKTMAKKQLRTKWSVLFLARIIMEKGIYETLEAVYLLQKKHPNIELLIAGDGNELDTVRSLVQERNMTGVKFYGYVQGLEKSRLFQNANIYCLPTYSEGMPTSVVEAMAFGLPVVTRPVGGIADFFENGKHGFATHSMEPTVIASLIERLFLHSDLYKDISYFNYEYAQSYFLASNAASRLEMIYTNLMTENSQEAIM